MQWQWRDCAKFECRARRAVPLLRKGQIDSESGKNDSASETSITRHGGRLLGAQAGLPVLLEGGGSRDQGLRYRMSRGSAVLCSRIW